MLSNRVDIIIPVYNQADLTKNCLESIVVHSDLPYRLILIDNASGDETRKSLEDFARSHKNTTLLRNQENLGWVKAVNQGIKLATSPYLCIMNNDTVVRTQAWLSKMIAVAEMAGDTGLVNPMFELKRELGDNKPFIEIDFCRGYCVLIKRAVIDKIGGLDEAYGLGYYDDDDFSVRAIRAGFKCVRANEIVVEHLKDSTFTELFKDDVRRSLHEKNKQLFYTRWGKRLKIVFIASKNSDRASLEDTLLFLARRQHIVYVWNRGMPLGLQHINIRERSFPSFLPPIVFELALSMNETRKEAKRYSMIFVDDQKLGSVLVKRRPAVHSIDVDKDAEKIAFMVDAAAKV
jgi:GT2 family glycosyltransferase